LPPPPPPHDYHHHQPSLCQEKRKFWENRQIVGVPAPRMRKKKVPSKYIQKKIRRIVSRGADMLLQEFTHWPRIPSPTPNSSTAAHATPSPNARPTRSTPDRTTKTTKKSPTTHLALTNHTPIKTPTGCVGVWVCRCVGVGVREEFKFEGWRGN